MSPEEAHREAVRRIAAARAEHAQVLDLGDLPLDALPEELGSLTELRVLALGQWSPRIGKDGVDWEWDPNRPAQGISDLSILGTQPGDAQGHCWYLEAQGISDLSILGTLTQLERISLTGCTEIKDVVPLAALTNLQSLFLNSTGVADVAPLAALANLQSLDLTDTGVTDVAPLAALANLQSLNLGYCRGVSDVAPLAALANLQSLNLGYCRGVSDVAPLAALANLQSLDLDSTGVADVAPLAALANLQSLNLSYCRGVTDVAPLAALANLQSLYLASTGVTDVAPLAALANLQSLDLSFCRGVADVAPLAALANLQSLDLESTGVADVAPLAALANLQSLYLASTGVTDVAPLAALANLQSLYLASTGVTDVAPLAALANLQSLDLSYCRGVTDVAPLAALANLQSLDLSNCRGVTDVAPLAALANLQSLDLASTGVTDVAPLAALTNLQSLDLESTGVADVAPLAALTNLQSLDLESTGVADVAPLAALVNLQSLDLCRCDKLRVFDRFHQLFPKLQELRLFDCHFNDLPEEVCGQASHENVLDQVKAHYADLEHGAAEDAEVKLFVLGNGGVGKTQLCRRLRGLPYDPDPNNVPTTHGVELHDFELTLTGRDRPVHVRFWDFGGQDVYHGTHALFLQGHAVFVLLWTPDHETGGTVEKGVEMRHHPLAYWLDYVRRLAGTVSPVLVVQSQCDGPEQCRPQPDVPVKDFRSRKFLEFSAKTDYGLDALVGHLKQAVQHLLHRRPLRQIGAGRAEVRERLRAMLEEDQVRPPAQRRHRTLTQDEFQALCQETGKVSDPAALLEFLHRSGVVFYRRGLFEDRIILDQSWALQAIYTLFDRQRTLPYLFRDGRFVRQTLAQLVWQDYSDAEQETFLGMMLSCGICFRVRNLAAPGRDAVWDYAAPDLLPDFADRGVQDQLAGWVPETPPTAAATARFGFLHEGILRTFLSRVGEQGRDAAVYWKYGCRFWEQKTRCKLLIQSRQGLGPEQPWAGEVTLSAWGEQAADLVESVLKTLLEVAVGQPPEVTRTPERQQPAPDAARGGIEDLEIVEPSVVVRAGKPQVFISYAWGEDTTAAGRQREEVVERLCARLRSWDYEVIRDKDAMRRGERISKFMHALTRGDRVVVVLSEKYLRSVFCMSELHGIYQYSRSQAEEFLRRILPLTLEDARIGSIRERAAHTRHWKGELDALLQLRNDNLLGMQDGMLLVKMSRWIVDVGDMLAHIADVLHPIGFEQIVDGDFAGVRQMLQRG